MVNSTNQDGRSFLLMKELYHDSIVYNLAIRGNEELSCLFPYDSTFIELGMYNRYDKNLYMIDELWMDFLKSDFVISSLGEIGGGYYFFKKAKNYEIKYRLNDIEVKREYFIKAEIKDFL